MTPLALVLLKLLAIALPLVGLAWGLRVYPRPRLVYAAIVPALAAWTILAAAEMTWLVAAIDAALLLLAAGRSVDPAAAKVALGRTPRRTHRLAAEESSGVAAGAEPFAAKADGARCATACRTSWTRGPPSSPCNCCRNSRSTLHYVLQPSRRGAFAIERVHVRARSRLGFWQ